MPMCLSIMRLFWHHANWSYVKKWILTDTNSTNGTFVDGQKITKVEVSVSSWIRVGAVFLVLSDNGIRTEELDQVLCA